MRNCAGYADTRSLLDRPTQALRPEVLKRVRDVESLSHLGREVGDEDGREPGAWPGAAGGVGS